MNKVRVVVGGDPAVNLDLLVDQRTLDKGEKYSVKKQARAFELPQ